jgi:energy-coupling factor transporter ATP-binding protein EcfA2
MQRVALAAAAAPRPRYYLMDEPASYLDPESRARLLAWTRERVDRGAAVLWTECEPAACEGADRVVALGGAEAAPSRAEAPAAGSPGKPLWTGNGLALTRRPGQRLWGGLDLEIREGERIALVGPNGSGKTALLDTLAGWIEPTEGTLVRPPRERVAALAQFPEYQLFAPTVLEDVRFGAARRKHARGDRADAAARSALTLAGLAPGDYEGRDPATLSLGNRRRVALAGVLATEPVALLLDEPTAGLDATGTDALIRALGQASGRGAALVVATHDPRVAARLGAGIVRLGTP